MTHFPDEIRERIQSTRLSLLQARLSGEDYLVEVRLGELESLAHIAAEHGITVDGVEESLASYGLQTPPRGLALVMDRHEDEVLAGRRGA